MRKIKVAVIFGGKSGEHEVSLMSATNIINAMDKNKYDIDMIGINKEGRWLAYAGELSGLLAGTWEGEALYMNMSALMNSNKYDVIFPVLHGPNGEDGTVQGLFELCNIPYVGCNVLSSAMCMDKEIAKKLFALAGLKIGNYIVISKKDFLQEPECIVEEIEKKLTYPVFVKPANMGSSVGISKCKNTDEVKNAIKLAMQYDKKIIIEENINGQEVECAVLGNDYPSASTPGEIISSKEFYDYTAKYFDGGVSQTIIPARINEEKIKEVKDIALQAFTALNCSGLARVDFFVEAETGEVYINEINTMPGFTKISMYPKMWQADGLGYSDLIDKLIELAMEE